MTSPTSGTFPRSGARPVPTSAHEATHVHREAQLRQTASRSARDPGSGPAQTSRPGDASVADLVGGITDNLSTLVRQELALVRAELRQEASRTAKAGGALAAAVTAAVMVSLWVSVAAWSGLSHLMQPGWAALVIAFVWAGVCTLLYLNGRAMLQRVSPAPTRTADTLSRVPRTLRGRTGDAP
jgi:hypothetical protein